MRTNYRHCEAASECEQRSNPIRNFGLTMKVMVLIGLLRHSLRSFLAMTIFLTIITTVASAQTVSICQHWIDGWRVAGGSLPGGSRVPTTSNASRVWSVTATTPVGSRTINGQAWCHNVSTGTGPLEHNTAGVHCWCRITNPYVGPWVFLFTDSTAAICAINCANDCSFCGLVGSNASCTRAALLALP